MPKSRFLSRETVRPSPLSLPLAALACLLVSATPASALIAFNDGDDEIFVTATAGVGYDSNLFASSSSDGDTSINASLLLEYERKAGMIGVDASVGWDFSKYSTYSEEDFANPRFNLKFSKESGRTTGTLRLGAQRENRADAAINLRTESWNYDAALDLKYPVIERYSFTGNLGYVRRDYRDNAVLVDLDTYAAGTDLHYALNSERDLLVGYRYRTTDTTADTTDEDHAVTVGVEGKIITKLNGKARIGVQRRSVERQDAADTDHTSLTAALGVTWTLTPRFSIVGDVSKDFMTLATDESVDTTTVSLIGQFAVNSKLSAYAGVTYSHLEFLETQQRSRRDDGVSPLAGAEYIFNERLRVSASYSYFQNASTLATSDFERHSISLNVTTHW